METRKDFHQELSSIVVQMHSILKEIIQMHALFTSNKILIQCNQKLEYLISLANKNTEVDWLEYKTLLSETIGNLTSYFKQEQNIQAMEFNAEELMSLMKLITRMAETQMQIALLTQ